VPNLTVCGENAVTEKIMPFIVEIRSFTVIRKLRSKYGLDIDIIVR
jgi:hypothetical protein